MKQEYKNDLAKMQSLMERMEGHYTLNEAQAYENSLLSEAARKRRRVASPEELFDILAQLDPMEGSGGRSTPKVTIGYVTAANLNYPTIKKKNPATNRMKSYPDMATFGADMGEQGEIGGVIKLTSYNLNFRNPERVGQRYSEYKNQANDIRQRYGLEPMASKSYTGNANFGDTGIKTYDGANDALRSHTYTPQNVFGAVKKSVYYLVGADGHIVREVDANALKNYFKGKAEVSGVPALRKMGVEEAKIQEYIKELTNLGMDYKNFEHSSILYIVCTVANEPLIYINDNLSQSINDIAVIPADFIAVAKDRYKKDLIEAGDTAIEYE